MHSIDSEVEPCGRRRWRWSSTRCVGHNGTRSRAPANAHILRRSRGRVAGRPTQHDSCGDRVEPLNQSGNRGGIGNRACVAVWTGDTDARVHAGAQSADGDREAAGSSGVVDRGGDGGGRGSDHDVLRRRIGRPECDAALHDTCRGRVGTRCESKQQRCCGDRPGVASGAGDGDIGEHIDREARDVEGNASRGQGIREDSRCRGGRHANRHGKGSRRRAVAVRPRRCARCSKRVATGSQIAQRRGHAYRGGIAVRSRHCNRCGHRLREPVHRDRDTPG